MKAKTRHIILIAALAFGAVWDYLCLAGALPIGMWPFSTGVICIGSLVTQLPLLFPSTASKEEPPGHTNTESLRKRDRIFAGILVGLAVIWIIATVMCLLES